MFTPWQPHSDWLAGIPAGVVAAALVLIGLALLLIGWRVYRVALVAAGVALGGLFGAALGSALDVPPVIPAVILGIVAGILAVALEKTAVFILGGLCGALPVLGAGEIAQAHYTHYLLAAAAFVLGGLVILLIWRIMIIVCMAFLGTWLTANGVVMGIEQFRPGAAPAWIMAHMTLFLLFFAAVWVFGVFCQIRGETGLVPKGEE